MERAEILQLIEQLTAKSKAEARKISRKLEDGKIGVDEWKAAILALLVSSHVIAASVGRGGRSAMQSSDWQRVNDKVTWQAGFLERRGRQIASGAITVATGVIAAIAVKYFAAPFVSFQSARVEAAKEESGNKGEDWVVARELNAAESCEDCIALEALGYIPVDEVTEIGSGTECGDYCKCTLDFKLASEV